MKCVEVYKELYHQEPFDVAFCPYRISPLGAHIDHQYGKINGLAIDKGIHMAYHPKQNGVVELQSLNFPKRAQFFVSAVPDEKQGDWADHLRGAAKMLGEKYRLKVGLSGIIEGSLPIGGLSSSASVIICFLSALCKVNGIHLEPMEMILTAKAAENQYVGVSCGKLDQSCEVLSKKNHLLYLDTKDDSYELIPTSEKMKPYKVAIFFSGLERSLKNSKYNLRQDECKAAAYALMGYAGMDYDTFANTRLRDVPYEVFEAYKDRLPELWRRRAEHYYSEFARAEKGAELWRKGDLDGYGQLVFESGKSSMCLWIWLSNYTSDIKDMMRIMGISATIFVVLIVPEIWKNRRNGAIEIEQASYYTLRQICTARMLMFGVVDLVIVMAFLAITYQTTILSLRDLVVNFLLPVNVSCCICFRVLYSRWEKSEYIAVLSCLVWVGLWMMIIANDVIYQKIVTPVWVAMLILTFVYFIFCVQKSLVFDEKILEDYTYEVRI